MKKGFKDFLLKDTLAYGLINNIHLFISIFLFPIYTRTLSKDQYGIMELFNSSTELVLALLPLGLSTIFMRDYNELKNEPEKQKSLLGTIYTIMLSTYGLFLAFAFLGRNYYLDNIIKLNNTQVNQIYIVGILAIFFANTNFFLDTVMKATFNRKYIVFTSLLNYFILTGLGFVFVYFLKMGVDGFFKASLIAGFVTFCFNIYFNKKYLYFSFNFGLAKHLLARSIHFTVGSVVIYGVSLYSKYVINQHISLVALGVYSVGARIASLVKIVIKPLNAAFYPYAVSIADEAENKIVFYNFHKIYIAICCMLGFGIILFRNELILLFAPDYKEALFIIPILTISYIILESINVYSMGIHFSKKTQYISISMGLYAISSIVFIHLLVPYFKINGVAIAYLLSAIVWIGSQYYYSQKFFPLEFNKKVIYLSAIAIVGVYFFDEFVLNLLPTIQLILSKVVICAIAIGVCTKYILKNYKLVK
jgi:O-antigen/teichoic acid export membrane protein